MAASNTPTQSIIDKMPPAQYMPTPEEEEALQAIPRSFLKFGALGFAGGAVVTHFSISTFLRESSKKSYLLRYGGPFAVGSLVGVFWGVKKIQEQIEHIVFDLPPSPLTNVYRKRFVRAAPNPAPTTPPTTSS